MNPMAKGNSIQLAGHLVSPPTVDGNFVRFTLVVPRKVAQGGTPHSDWIPISCSGSSANIALEHLKPGTKCQITGEIKTFGASWAVVAKSITLGAWNGRKNLAQISGYLVRDLSISEQGFVKLYLIVQDHICVPVTCSGDPARDAKKYLKKNSNTKITGELRTFGKNTEGITEWSIRAKSVMVGS